MVDVGVVFGKLCRLFSRLPDKPAVCPEAFAFVTSDAEPSTGPVVAIQLVADRLFFLLFGAIGLLLQQRGAGAIELVIVRAISGAVGTGWQAELKRSAPVVRLWTDAWKRAYGRAVQRVAYRSASWDRPAEDWVDWVHSAALWRKLQICERVAEFAVDGIEIGDLLIDSYLRFRPSPSFNAADPFVRRLLWQALRDIRRARKYFRRVRPRWYLTSYSTYLEHGVPVRVALYEGVDVRSFGNINAFGKRLTLLDTYHTPNVADYRRQFDLLPEQDACLEQARVQLEARMMGGIDAATRYMRQSAYATRVVKLPEGLRGAVVVFLHDFYDSPHIYADLVFHDFWSWICHTIETLDEAGIPFFLKPHPNQIDLSSDVLERLKAIYPRLNWLPASASNRQLAEAGIACGVTVYGTVAHELAYMGIPSIGCARHPHYTFDFCRTAASRDEYTRMLLKPAEVVLRRDEMSRQALAFYYMHNLHGDADERALQQAFADLWSACNREDASWDEVMGRFGEILAQPGLGRFLDRLAEPRQPTVARA
jgi:hypothetical protein